MTFIEDSVPEVASSINHGKVFTRFMKGDATLYSRAKALIELDNILSTEYSGRALYCIAIDPATALKQNDDGTAPVDDSDAVAQDSTRSRIEYRYIDDGGKQVCNSLGYFTSKELNSLAEALKMYNANAEVYTKDVRLMQIARATKPVLLSRDLTVGRSEKAVAKMITKGV